MKLTEQQIERQLTHYEFIADLPNSAKSKWRQDCWRYNYERRLERAQRHNDPDFVDWFFDEFEAEMEAAE